MCIFITKVRTYYIFAGLSTKFVQGFCNILWKNSNELFGQSNICYLLCLFLFNGLFAFISICSRYCPYSTHIPLETFIISTHHSLTASGQYVHLCWIAPSSHWNQFAQWLVEWKYLGIKVPLRDSFPFSSVQSLSHIRLFATPWITARQASLSVTNFWSLPKHMSVKLVMPSSYLILCHPLLLLPPILPNIRVFSNESTLRMRWPEYWSFSFSISPSNGHPGLISFRMDWLDLLAVQGTLKNLLQYYSSKARILQHSAFFTSNSHTHTWPLEKP